VDEIKFLIANICLQNSKMGVLKIRGFIMFMLFYDIKKTPKKVRLLLD